MLCHSAHGMLGLSWKVLTDETQERISSENFVHTLQDLGNMLRFYLRVKVIARITLHTGL